MARPPAVAELLNVASSTIERDLLRIELAAAAGDAKGVLEAAHRLKGTSGSISAGNVAELSSSIEEAARAEVWDISPPLILALREAVDVLQREIESYSVLHLEGPVPANGTHAVLAIEKI